jgi:hypothetical protein
MWSKRIRGCRGALRDSKRWAPCAITITALAAAGCGGGSATTRSTQTVAGGDLAGPRARLIAEADVICKRRNAALEALPLSGSSARPVERYAARSAALEASALTELSGLAVPPSMAHEWQQMLNYTQAIRGDFINLREDAKRDDTRSVPALSRSLTAVKHQLQIVATSAGFKDCSGS